MSDVDVKIATMETIIGYTFTNKLLCAEALQRMAPQVTLSIAGMPCNIESSQKLESVGDTVIDFVLYSHLLTKLIGKPYNVGDWDQVRQHVASNKSLTRVGRAAGMHGCILAHQGVPIATDSMIADTVEAIIGAASIDAGDKALEVAGAIMTRLGISRPPLPVNA
ncbi:hypothetical protein ACEQ8H_005801 [Pleosporales sp. CAS-2024a]